MIKNALVALLLSSLLVLPLQGQQPQKQQAKLFRDRKLVYEGGLKPIDFTGQTDLERITGGGGLQLGMLPAGEYILQLFVNDALAQEKNRTATQWIDFEIVQ